MIAYPTMLRLRCRLLDTANQEVASWRSAPPSADAVGEGIRVFLWQRDRFAETYRDILEYVPEWGKHEIEEVVRGLSLVCRCALVLGDTLRALVNQLAAAGQQTPGAKDLEGAAADFERWLEDAPDEVLLHYPPVTESLEKAALEALRNPPSASDWRSLFDEGANSRP
jgi:hypothetical protein